MGKFSPGRNSFAFYDDDGNRRSEVIFRHLDDLQSLTNMNLSGFWIDQAEEVSEDAFDFLIGRIRRNGPELTRREGFITFNMEGHNWIWRRFLKGLDRVGDPLKNRSDYFLVTASTLENKQNLPEEYVTGLMAQPKEYVDRFVHGSWDTFAGKIFDEFSSIHIIEPFNIPPDWGWERIRSIDHGQKHATGCLWAAIDYQGNIYIYREYKRANEIVSNHVKMINKMSYSTDEAGRMAEEQYTYTVIDPSTHAKTKEKDGYHFSVADEYMDAGIATIPGQNEVIAGINRVKEFLRVDPEHYHPFKKLDGEPIRGAPHLYIFNSCTDLIEEIQQYKWKQVFGMNTKPDSDEIKERPVKRNDDLVDPLRYLIMSRPQSPQHLASITPWVFSNSLELARRAQAMGMTVDDLIAGRRGETVVRHSTTGINHQSGLH